MKPRWADEDALTGTLGIDPKVQVYNAEAGKWKLSYQEGFARDSLRLASGFTQHNPPSLFLRGPSWLRITRNIVTLSAPNARCGLGFRHNVLSTPGWLRVPRAGPGRSGRSLTLCLDLPCTNHPRAAD
jgi:hypothetical protein